MSRQKLCGTPFYGMAQSHNLVVKESRVVGMESPNTQAQEEATFPRGGVSFRFLPWVVWCPPGQIKKFPSQQTTWLEIPRLIPDKKCESHGRTIQNERSTMQLLLSS